MRELKDTIISVKNRECSVESLGLGCDRPELFTLCQWQMEKDKVSIIYLIYRSLHAFFFVSVICWSMWDAATPKPPLESYLSKWPIYLTHWGLTLCTVQDVLSLGLLVDRLVSQIKDSENGYNSMSVKYKVYWALHTTAVLVAIGITGSYFVGVYKPGETKLTALNLSMHGFNSWLMIFDLFVVSHPFRLLHYYWPSCFIILYFCFSGIYYLAGGTASDNQKHIYEAVNWAKPGFTFLVIFCGLLYVLLAHFLMWLLVLGRTKLGDACVMQSSTPVNNQVQPA